MHEVFFYLFALLAVGGALGVVIFRQPIHGALSLLLTLLSVAALFLLRGAEFLAATQIVLYAGGILTLFLFAIMFVSFREAERMRKWTVQWPAAWILGALLILSMGGFVWHAASEAPVGMGPLNDQYGGNTEAISHVLFNQYLIPFEVVSLFLLVAMVGAIVMASWGVKK
jgi:NADH-quinone oxidoreductase subunit J